MTMLTHAHRGSLNANFVHPLSEDILAGHSNVSTSTRPQLDDSRENTFSTRVSLNLRFLERLRKERHDDESAPTWKAVPISYRTVATHLRSVTQLKPDAGSGGLGPLGNGGDLSCSDSLFDLNRAPDIIQQQPPNVGHRGLAGDPVIGGSANIGMGQLGKLQVAEHRHPIIPNSPDFVANADGECDLLFASSIGAPTSRGAGGGSVGGHPAGLSLANTITSSGYGGFTVSGAGGGSAGVLGSTCVLSPVLNLDHQTAATLLADACGTLRRNGANSHKHNVSQVRIRGECPRRREAALRRDASIMAFRCG
ncbi:hypothetical protein BIW11_13335 [Tropilaelaps mercedesae]|uniref:Uncharacterized protein n=1 Tax=Tropilaelaps mercedesae TaxID=418985 RepID=A0A1V9X2N7_9ACAR|nr:hypothetical protein BIW11_13335 [Tropilaelaps mercedesae]